MTMVIFYDPGLEDFEDIRQLHGLVVDDLIPFFEQLTFAAFLAFFLFFFFFTHGKTYYTA
jgi:hypothetical protein